MHFNSGLQIIKVAVPVGEESGGAGVSNYNRDIKTQETTRMKLDKRWIL